jgi:hypothetical protein
MRYYHRPQSNHSLTLLSIALCFLIGFFVYNYTSPHQAQAVDSALVSDPTTASDSPFTPQQLALLGKIESIRLDGSLFKDPAFLSLHDWTVDLGHEDAGKSNPFAPLGASQSAPAKPVKR